MGGQDGFTRSPLSYDISSDTFMAGITLRPNDRVKLGVHLTYNDASSGLEQFELTADEYEARTPSTSFDFDQSHTYSDLDTSRLEGELEARYSLNDSFWLGGWYRYIEFTDDAPYLYDTTGKVQFITAAVGYTF